MKKLGIVVGIPVHNEERNISRLLDSILSERLSRANLDKVIVVSSGSFDRTDYIVKDYEKKTNGKVVLVREKERRGKYSALRIIFSMVKESDVLFLIPGDVVPFPRAIDRLSLYFFDSGVGAVSGAPVPLDVGKKSIVMKVAGCLWDFHNHFFSLQKHDSPHLCGELMALRPNLIVTFPPVVNDDAFIAQIVRAKGFKIIFDEEAKVKIFVPDNVADYLKQRIRISAGHKQVLQFGYRPKSLITVGAEKDINKFFNAFYGMIKNRKHSLVHIAIFLLLEFFILFMSVIARPKKHVVWSVAKSTKGVTPNE